MPPGHNSDRFREIVLDNYNMSLGTGLTKLAGKVFRIGHLGACNDLILMGALAGIERWLSASPAYRTHLMASPPLAIISPGLLVREGAELILAERDQLSTCCICSKVERRIF
jgi:hypothetical protein